MPSVCVCVCLVYGRAYNMLCKIRTKSDVVYPQYESTSQVCSTILNPPTRLPTCAPVSPILLSSPHPHYRLPTCHPVHRPPTCSTNLSTTLVMCHKFACITFCITRLSMHQSSLLCCAKEPDTFNPVCVCVCVGVWVYVGVASGPHPQ